MNGSVRQPTAVFNSAESGNKYVSLYVLLAGISGGMLLVLSLFVFCKFCRGKSKTTEDNNEWAFNHDGSRQYRNVEPGELYIEDAAISPRLQKIRERINEEGSESAESVSVDIGRAEGEESSRPWVCSPTRSGDEHTKPAVLLQRQISIRGEQTFSTSECEVAVEVHTKVKSVAPSEDTSATQIVDQIPRVSSPLGVVLEWEAQSEEIGDADSSPRVPSTDWTTLETSLEFWHKEHSRVSHCEDEEESFSKVRYNDTGSLEEVNVDHLVDYYVEDNDLITEAQAEAEAEREDLQLQYRRLWQLRATLEEDEELLEPNDSKEEQDDDIRAQISQSKSSRDHSPEVEVATSHTTSFESNTEPLLEEPNRWSVHGLHMPSYEARRQTYRNILSWRLRRMEAWKHHPQGQQHQPSLEDTSFDSIDTVDTEGSSTDASRIEQATTSFESTTDNTDSTGECQAHRLQQLRADSGYRSLENPPTSKLSRHHLSQGESSELDILPMKPSFCLLSLGDSGQEHLYHHLTIAEKSENELSPKKIKSLGESGEMDFLSKSISSKSKYYLPSQSDRECSHQPEYQSGKFSKLHVKLEQSVDTEIDEGVCGLQPSKTSDEKKWEERHRGFIRSASKKRREFMGGHGTALTGSGEVEHYHQHRYRSTHNYTRDYSVDEKSDALFREFSRCDLSQEQVPMRQRLSGSSYRRLQHTHSRHIPYSHSDSPRKFSEAHSSIDEEYSSHPLPVRYLDEDSQLATVPIICVADEDSSDHI